VLCRARVQEAPGSGQTQPDIRQQPTVKVNDKTIMIHISHYSIGTEVGNDTMAGLDIWK
jgi:hypothetical protein